MSCKLGFGIAHPGDSRPLRITCTDASKPHLSFGITHLSPLQAPTWLWHHPHWVLPSPLPLLIHMSSSPLTLPTQMSQIPNFTSALLTPMPPRPNLDLALHVQVPPNPLALLTLQGQQGGPSPIPSPGATHQGQR